ncbi:MAG: SRPBCC family protein [Streptosporangiales bacterium]|nr:SRPBCC family protein [Streptosporangiales bacterium]
MFEFTETISIHAEPSTVWDVMHDLEKWWPASNPEHESLERLDDRGIEPGARLRIREKIVGVPGEAVGTITRVEPGAEVTWDAPEARYWWLGMGLTVGEGVTWSLDPGSGADTRVIAHVWATFAPGRAGHLTEWLFKNVLDGERKDREHARTELRYLKRVIEEAGRPPAVQDD